MRTGMLCRNRELGRGTIETLFECTAMSSSAADTSRCPAKGFHWLLLAALFATAHSGCAALIGKSYSDADRLDMTPVVKEGYSVGAHGVMQPLPSTEDNPSIILEVNNGKRTLERVPLVAGQPMFVADLMRDAELHKKIGRVKVSVLRPNGSNPPVRMDIDFDATGKRVQEGMNYSLRPGDHVIVSADSRNFMSKLFNGSVFGRALN